MLTAGRFQVLVEWDPDAALWVTLVPSLNFLSTYGNSREDALERTREAILGYFEALVQEHLPLPMAGPVLELVELDVAGVRPGTAD